MKRILSVTILFVSIALGGCSVCGQGFIDAWNTTNAAVNNRSSNALSLINSFEDNYGGAVCPATETATGIDQSMDAESVDSCMESYSSPLVFAKVSADESGSHTSGGPSLFSFLRRTTASKDKAN